jgi:Tol biopolymer transport system component
LAILTCACGVSEKAGLDVIPCADQYPARTAEKILFQAPDREGDTRIFRVDADGRGICRMGEGPDYDPPGAEQMPAWSPSADRIVWVGTREGRQGLWEAGIDGEAPQLIAAGDFAHPRFAPDGRTIALIDRSGSSLSLVYPADGQLEALTEPGETTPERPAWDPSGRYLYFEAPHSGKPAIFMLDLAELSAGSQLMLPNASAPAVSPTGEAMAFIRQGIPYVAPRRLDDGSLVDEPQRVDPDAVGDAPSWSPDGAHLSFASRLIGPLNLFFVSPGEGDLFQLTSGPGDKGEPDWSLQTLPGDEGY